MKIDIMTMTSMTSSIIDHISCAISQFVQSLAQSTENSLPYLEFQVLMLEAGQELNQHRDYHNHPDFPNHTLNLGKFSGRQLKMLREGE